MDTDPIVVYHERLKLPLFCTHYNVMITQGWSYLHEHLALLYPGLKLDIDKNADGYTCIVKHPEQSAKIFIFINTEDSAIGRDIHSTIVHECVHLSWHIMEEAQIEIDEDNHEPQAHIIEELVREVTRVYEASMENKNDLDEL